MKNKLELKHLATAFTNKQKVLYFDDERELNQVCRIVELREEELTITDGEYQYDVSFNDVKLISRPLSDLTKEIEVNGEKFVPVVELAKLAITWIDEKSIEKNINKYYTENSSRKSHRVQLFDYMDFAFNEYQNTFTLYEKRPNSDKHFQYFGNHLQLFEKLYEWHFDIHGLIEKGLAIDKNNL